MIPAQGEYEMRASVVIDPHGLVYPHDTGEMLFAEWWVKRGASFVPTDALVAIRDGRRAKQEENDRLRAEVQRLQAEVNRLNRLHDERDAIERGRLGGAS